VTGLALQFAIGTPMYAAAELLIGPTLIPGLMATGLIVLALGSPMVAGEPLRKTDLAAVAIIVVAVALFGLSRLSIDLGGMDLLRASLVLRFAAMTAAVTVLALLLFVIARVRKAGRGSLLIFAAGLLFSLGNLWLGVVMAALARIVSGAAHMPLVVAGAVALAVVIATNLVSVVWTQEAFRHGRAASLVPLQQVPIQIVPALSYFLVFLLSPPLPSSPYLAIGGVLLILVGSTILGAGTGASAGHGGAERAA
jgi:hypothetical protein